MFDISAAETGSGSIFLVRVSAEERSDLVDGDDDEAIPGGVSSRTQIQARGTVEKSNPEGQILVFLVTGTVFLGGERGSEKGRGFSWVDAGWGTTARRRPREAKKEAGRR